MEEFLRTFRTRSQVRMSTKEKEAFNKAVGYDEDMSFEDLANIYDKVHEWYDIEMDEMDEDEAIDIMPTYQLVMKYMRKSWLHLK